MFRILFRWQVDEFKCYRGNTIRWIHHPVWWGPSSSFFLLLSFSLAIWCTRYAVITLVFFFLFSPAQLSVLARSCDSDSFFFFFYAVKMTMTLKLEEKKNATNSAPNRERFLIAKRSNPCAFNVDLVLACHFEKSDVAQIYTHTQNEYKHSNDTASPVFIDLIFIFSRWRSR